MKTDMIGIRWHGRGGQGAITAAKIVAKAGFEAGYRGIVMVPTFGTERRGAPVFTSLKISRDKIYDLSPIEFPDVVVVLDHLLLGEVDVLHGLKDRGTLVLNSPLKPTNYASNGIRVATCDITSLAGQAGLPKGVVNSGIIGSLARACDFMNMDMGLLTQAIREEFQGIKPEENARAAGLAYDQTCIGGA